MCHYTSRILVAYLFPQVIGVVGGLSLNPYFTAQVKQWGANNGQITVKQPEHPSVEVRTAQLP